MENEISEELDEKIPPTDEEEVFEDTKTSEINGCDDDEQQDDESEKSNQIIDDTPTKQIEENDEVHGNVMS